jgi:hypothetical protein
MCNHTRFKRGEKGFIIPSALVYVILKEFERMEDKFKEKTIKVLMKSSKRNIMEIASFLLHNTLQWGNKRSLRKKLIKINVFANY